MQLVKLLVMHGFQNNQESQLVFGMEQQAALPIQLAIK